MSKDKIRNCFGIAVFLLITAGLGLLSHRNLLRFYVNNEKDYNDWSPELGNKFETDMASTFYDKFGFVNLNGAISSLLGQPSMNGVVKLENGWLLTPMDYSSDETLLRYADATAKVNDYLKSREIPLVYVTTPYTSSGYDPKLPKGIYDHGNDNIDRFMEMLREEGVDTIDIRERMYEDGIDHYEMMYRTDHHWTTEAGLYAYGLLEDYIREKTGCIVDERISDINSYTVTKYEKWHLGSNGQRTGIYYSGIDDFDLILPDFETALTDQDGNTGSMQDLMIDMEPLSDRDYKSRYTYDHVMKNTLGNFTNLRSKNDIKVVFITDSFGRAVNQYLAMGFGQVVYVSDRDVSGFTPAFIDAFDPDVVIMMYYPMFLQEGSDAFSFNGF
ncbi:MAG: hypothetical protein K5886_02980 [Lachnospiraceae bacterium]|nr:hypothetical protein [Lachnospiraceae bacterium]